MKEQKEEEKLVPVIVRIPKYKKDMLEKLATKQGRYEADIVRSGIDKELDLQIYKDNLDFIIKENEIYFQDELISENKEINAYISTSNIDLKEKFGLKHKNDMYYDMYLNYKYLEKKLYIEIVKVEDEKRNYYIYIPTEGEKKMLMKKLEEYIEKNYNQSIEEFIKEVEMEEVEEY